MGTTRRQTTAELIIPDRPVALTRYDAACRAIAQAKSVDEVSKIRNTATALRAYAKQAKNRQLEIDAAEIRIRAERKLGELISAQRKSVGLNSGAKGRGSNQHQVRVGNKPAPPTLAAAGVDKNLADRARKLAAVPAAQFEAQIDHWRDKVQEPAARVTTAIHFSSKTAEHYTPVEVISLVIACLGAIDLDPCSNSDTTANVPAARHFSRDGLTQPWAGRVYMNPPYGREIDQWIDKLCTSHEHGEVTEAIALVPARTDTKWFHRLRNYVCCFVSGRLTFIGNSAAAPFPSAIVYLGDDLGKFYEHFHGVGDLWQRVQRGVHFGE